MTANPGQSTLSTHHTLTMTDTRHVFADFENMVWIPRKWLMKKTMDIGDKTDEFELGIS